MACPTKEEYGEALKTQEYLYTVIGLENERRDDLINQLCGSQKLLDGYREALNYQQDIIMKYKIYQELSSYYE